MPSVRRHITVPFCIFVRSLVKRHVAKLRLKYLFLFLARGLVTKNVNINIQGSSSTTSATIRTSDKRDLQKRS